MMNGLASTSEFKRVRWVVLLLCLVCVHLILLDTRAFAQEAGGEAATAAAAAAPEGPPPPLIPENISTHGAEIDGLFNLILIITSITMVGVLGLMAIFLVKYRYREGRKGAYTHGSHKLEVVWTIVTAVILIFIAFIQIDVWVKIKQDKPPEEDAFLVRVFGEQFGWHFVYPGADGKFEPNRLEDQFAGFNDLGLKNPQGDVIRPTLLIPKGKKVLLQINSLGKYDQNTQKETLAVLHSFFAPNLRIKQDLVPYHPGYVWFEATKTGTYEIACAELCGLGHYRMRADLKVLSDEELATALGYDWKNTPATFEGVKKTARNAPRPAARKAADRREGTGD